MIRANVIEDREAIMARFLNGLDANLVITWSRNPHAKTPIPGKPSKSGLIGVWHKDNLYLGTSTIRNRKPRPTNIYLQTRDIRMTPWSLLFFDTSFFVLYRTMEGRLSHQHIHIQSTTNKKFINLNSLTYMSGYAFIYINTRLK
jgi:hypothetical protein